MCVPHEAWGVLDSDSCCVSGVSTSLFRGSDRWHSRHYVSRMSVATPIDFMCIPQFYFNDWSHTSHLCFVEKAYFAI